MAEPNLDIGLEYTGGIRKPTADQVSNYARVVVDQYGEPNLDYVGGPYIDPVDFNAAGDGAVNDTAALLNAITAAKLAGKPVDGMGRWYGVAGNLTLEAYAWLRNVKLKQLTPGGGTRRTLTSAGGDGIRLEYVTVDRNGDGTNGAHQVDAGIYIDGGSNHRFTDVEVYGDDLGGGFFLFNATDCELVGVYTHDIKYSLGADPGNDRVMGIYLNGCTRVRLLCCRANDLGGDFGAGYTLWWTRGIAFSQCTAVQVLGCRVRMVDQGFDTTGGSDGIANSRFLFGDCYAGDCGFVGFKFSNTACDGQVDNCIAERCNLWGFVVNGPTGAGLTAIASRDVQFTNCTAYDIGYAGLPGGSHGGTKVGFRVMQGTFDLDTTIGIRFIGCKAIDRQSVRTMFYGFENEIAANINGKYNEAVGCVSVGHLGRAFQNMNEARCEITRTVAQSIAVSGTWTAVNWDADTDLGAMHDTSVNSMNVTTRRDGNYRTNVGVVFAANATGQRGVRILREGVVIPGTTVLVNAAAAGETALTTSWTSAMGAGDNLRIEVLQTSGGALNLQTTSGGVVEQVD